MRKTTKGKNTGIRWNFSTKLDDLDYADDIALLSSTKDQLQRKHTDVSKHAHTTGLKITAAKTKVMRLNANNNQPITSANQIPIESFTYLGAIITTSGGTNDDIRRSLGLTRRTHNFSPVWNSSQKQQNFVYSNVLSFLLVAVKPGR